MGVVSDEDGGVIAQLLLNSFISVGKKFSSLKKIKKRSEVKKVKKP